MKEQNSFSECDGHIESVLIGCQTVKVSFQTWNAKKIVLIYDDVERVEEQHAVFGDISDYIEKRANDGLIKYEFWDVNDEVVLSILAKSVKIYEVGENADIDSALFHLGCDYIGGQHRT